MGELISGLNSTLLIKEAMAIVNESLDSYRVLSYYGYTVESLTGPVPENDYGIEWQKGTPQYHKELLAYREGGLGGNDKLYHLINCIKLDLPSFQFVAKGYINTEVIRVLRACCSHKDLGVAGAASSGKTFPIAAYILQDWKAAPHATLSFVCTTSMAASEDRIWGAIIKLFQSARYKFGTYIPHKNMIVYGKFTDDAQDREYNAAIKALAIPKGREGQNAIDTTRGRKQTRVRLVFDELPEMELYVTNAAVNLEANEDLQVIGIGNPSNHLDAHGQMCCPDHPRGYKSIDRHTPEWKTKTGWCIFLNGEWSFNMQAPESEPIPAKYITNRETLAKMLNRCHGDKDSLEYYRNAIGFWPDGAISVTILTIDLIEQKKCHEQVKWRQTERKAVCGFDTSFTIGGDKCVAQFGEVGDTMQGRKVVQWTEQVIYTVPAFGVFEDQLAKALVNDCIKRKVSPDAFGMDISADGGKIMKAIIRYWLSLGNLNAAEVCALSSMERPSERIVSNVDPRKSCDAYDRKVTEYWMSVREGVICQNIMGIPIYEGQHVTPLVHQLCTRTYEIRGKKFAIETKKDMKDRTLGVSPDHADAFAYMVEMARRHGLVFHSPDDEDRAETQRDKYREEQRQHSESEGQEYAGYDSDDWGEDSLAA